MRETEKKKRKQKKKGAADVLLNLAIVVCLAVMGYSAFRLLTTLHSYRQGQKEYAALQAYTEPVPEPEDTSIVPLEAVVSTVSDPAKETGLKPPVRVDFEALREINPDIVAWICVEALDISYPVVQGEDDDYYLHRTFTRQDNFAGTIFAEYLNAPDFSDPNTILYGHNMKDGSMFGRLKNLTEKDLVKNDDTFWILTPEKSYHYRMFALGDMDVGSDAYLLFQDRNEEFTDWCTAMYDRSAAELEKPDFDLNSRVVTLSTCTDDVTQRYVVQGALVGEADAP